MGLGAQLARPGLGESGRLPTGRPMSAERGPGRGAWQRPERTGRAAAGLDAV